MKNFILTQPYNREKYIDLLQHKLLPEDFKLDQANIPIQESAKYISSAVRLGESKLLDLVVYEVRHTGKNDPRVGLSKEAFRLLAGEWKMKALVFFIPEDDNSNYRLSLIQIELKGTPDTAKVDRIYSNPRRYSYKLGRGKDVGRRTLIKYLLGVEDNKSLEGDFINYIKRIKDSKDLFDRFSVEILTKEFYKELSNWYAWAIKEVAFPGEQNLEENDLIEHRSKNVIRMLTRLLFVWFLKQKDLVPSQLFDESYLKEKLIKEFNPNLSNDNLLGLKDLKSKYYKAILQNLFFATLNCPITPQGKDDKRTRGFRKDDHYGQGFGYDHLMRYKKLFIDPNLFLSLVNECVPFLNGGLFDCLDNKLHKVYIDGFSDNLIKPNKLIVPDYLFFGETRGKGQDLSDYFGDKKKKNVDVLGLLDILKRYNFTVEENTPFDKDVSLDPELLGKVFENLLAMYNPETKATARKQTGSFYTPREIVQYMVDESLVAHLKRTVGEDNEEEYRKLMRYTDEEVNLSDHQKREIIKSLQNCKILDPACGSGAFPVGVLQQMVHILSQLDPSNDIWENLILSEHMKELGSTLEISAENERTEIQDDINKSFNNSINSPDYARKLYLIEKCIYGVDIQSIAIQISKLRFFISLIVDQSPNSDKSENFGIRPLPNLEAKFVAANTLIGIKKENNLFDDPKVDKLQEKLIRVCHRIYGAVSNKRKNTYKEDVKKIRSEITTLLENNNSIGNETARQLEQWDMFDQNSSSPFFDAEWMFGIQDGFDIVIGNPPYLKEGRASKTVFDGVRTSPYYQGKMDLWYMFACDGIDFLSDGGVLCYIATNNWVTNSGASVMRNKVLKDTKILQLNDFSNFMIFESASIQTMVMLFQKNSLDDGYVIDYSRLMGDTTIKDVVAMLDKSKTSQVEYLAPLFKRLDFINKYITFSSNDFLLDKIQNTPNVIFLTSKELAQGIVFPQDFLNNKNQIILGSNYHVGQGVFALTDKELSNMSLNDSELQIMKPLYSTSQINRYYSSQKNSTWAIYTDSSYKNPNSLDSCPNLKNHLDKFADIITSDNKPYGLHRAREERFFKGEKIIALRKCVERPLFSYADFDTYVSATFYVIKTDRIDMKYLTGLLNSKLIKFWLKNRGKMQGYNYQLDKEPLMQIPIAIPSEKLQKTIATLVDYIIWLKANPETIINKYVDNDYIAEIIEDIIDTLVYEYYFSADFKAIEISMLEELELDSDIISFYNNLKSENSIILNQLKLIKIELRELLMPIITA